MGHHNNPHEFQHISQVIRQKYPRSPELLARRRWILNYSIAVACITVVVATPAAIYFLANIQLLPAAATLAIALTAAFGPKIYIDFIQPRSAPDEPR